MEGSDIPVIVSYISQLSGGGTRIIPSDVSHGTSGFSWLSDITDTVHDFHTLSTAVPMARTRGKCLTASPLPTWRYLASLKTPDDAFRLRLRIQDRTTLRSVPQMSHDRRKPVPHVSRAGVIIQNAKTKVERAQQNQCYLTATRTLLSSATVFTMTSFDESCGYPNMLLSVAASFLLPK